MSAELDLDDVAGPHPKAKAELDALRAELAALKPEVDDLRDALEKAIEAMVERREYCRQMWDYKYGERWDEEEADVREAIARHGKEGA